MKIPATVIISTKNEQLAIDRCIGSLKDFQEVIVVDSASHDQTAEIARQLGISVVDFRWNGQYPKKKQWCLENVTTTSPWILFVDADEFPTVKLLEELEALFARHDIDTFAAFDIALNYHFGGKQLQYGHRVVKRALVHRDRVTFPQLFDLEASGMGELEGHYQPTVRGRVGRLSGRLTHDDPDPLGTWISRHNGYADWEAYLRTDRRASRQVATLRSRQGRFFARVPGKPVVFFLYTYLLRMGFLDGRAGLDYALGLSFYYWLINAKTRERRRGESR